MMSYDFFSFSMFVRRLHRMGIAENNHNCRCPYFHLKKVLIPRPSENAYIQTFNFITDVGLVLLVINDWR